MLLGINDNALRRIAQAQDQTTPVDTALQGQDEFATFGTDDTMLDLVAELESRVVHLEEQLGIQVETNATLVQRVDQLDVTVEDYRDHLTEYAADIYQQQSSLEKLTTEMQNMSQQPATQAPATQAPATQEPTVREPAVGERPSVVFDSGPEEGYAGYGDDTGGGGVMDKIKQMNPFKKKKQQPWKGGVFDYLDQPAEPEAQSGRNPYYY
ncbi:MAG: hypothetical protein DRP01_02110 [Archaeoglobales archaeon]|nr:MAG: hypothetical protein DRP01_02110 [Archaeoglobales archaeon]